MTIGIFIDNFFDPQKYKDPGLISESLVEIDCEVTVYCLSTNLGNFNGVKVRKISKKQAESPLFWRSEEIEIAMIYSWLSLRFSKTIKALKSSNKKIVLKLDSDGRLFSPLKPAYLRTFGKNRSPRGVLVHLLRILQWSIFLKIIDKKKIEQLAISDAAIIESPLAKNNIIYSLIHHHRADLIKKLAFIPNPIGIDFIKAEAGDIKNKKNTIISIGRWDDNQKNKNGLISVIKNSRLKNWEFIIIGKKSSIIAESVRNFVDSQRIIALEEVPHAEIFEYLKTSKIFLSPSYYESFNLAAAEALCCGCSLVGTPLESFRYFTHQEKYGTTSKSFEAGDINSALEREIINWNNGARNPLVTAEYWQEKLAPEIIAKKLVYLFNKI